MIGLSSERRTIALGGTSSALAAISCGMNAMSGNSSVPALTWTVATVGLITAVIAAVQFVRSGRDE